MRRDDPRYLGPILELALSGNPGAVDSLLALIRPYLHLLVGRLEPGASPSADRSDLVQETLLRLHRGLSTEGTGESARFRGRDVPQFLGWAGQVVRNVVSESARHQSAGKRDRGCEVGGLITQGLPSSEESPAQQLERAEEAIRLAEALEQLTEPRRRLIQARFLDGRSYDEISRETGKSVGSLQVLALRAVQQLREIMESRT